MQAFESTGLWWLPDDESTRTAGTLRVSSDGELNLSLIGSLGLDADSPNKRHRVILGSVDTSPSGNEVTLTGCLQMGFTQGPFLGPREKYQVSRAYFGAFLPDESHLTFRSMLIQIGGLTEWGHTILGLQHENVPFLTKEGETVSIIKYHRHLRPTCSLSDASIMLNMGISTKSSSSEHLFREEANLLIDVHSSQPIENLNEFYITPLQNLLTFVSDRPQEVKRLTVWQFTDRSDKKANPEIRVIDQRVQPEEGNESKRVLGWRQMLFTLKDINFQILIINWLTLSRKYSDAVNGFFGLEFDPPSYIDILFILLLLDLYLYYDHTDFGNDRRAEEERHLREVIATLSKRDAQWLIDHLGVRPHLPFQTVLRGLVSQHGEAIDPLFSHRRDAFVSQVITTQRYLNYRDPEDKVATCEGADLYWLIQKLRFLIKACFLSELGFSSDKILAMFQRNALYQHMCKLESARESNRGTPSAGVPPPADSPQGG